MNLDSSPPGEPVTLEHPEASTGQVRRLAELGLRAGRQVVPLHRTSGGGRLIGVGTSRIAMAKSTLTGIGIRQGHNGRPSGSKPSKDSLTEPACCAQPAAATAGNGATPPAATKTKTLYSCHDEALRCAPEGSPVVALAGNPNVGKSTLFNTLTGSRRQISNWPGTSVEAGRGAWQAGKNTLALVDLPGAYSLDPASPDEELTRALLVDVPHEQRPDLVVVAISAATVARGLYLLSQILETGIRTIVALTMIDVASGHGTELDPHRLALATGVEVISLDPRRGSGIKELERAVNWALAGKRPSPLHLVLDEQTSAEDPELAIVDARFAWIDEVVESSVNSAQPGRRSRADQVDRIVTSPVLGPIIFLAVMWLVFQITTAGSAPMVDALDRLVSGPVSGGARAALGWAGLGGGWVEGLLVDGVIAGVGMVLTFVPLMTLMFVVLALLEDSGYLARTAVVADRLMRVVGLPGRAFVPLIVGFGCNVPAISATRILPNARHRLMTALLVPFTSCSARLPVYVLVAAATFGDHAGNVVFGMYLASIGFVILGGLILQATMFRGSQPEPLLIDLPSYQVPVPRILLSVTWSRLQAFLRTATGIIVGAVVAVWLLTALPAKPGVGGFGQVEVSNSAFAAIAKTIAPVFGPAGFDDWHMAGSLMVGVVAKEAVVSSWAQTYGAAEPKNLAKPEALGNAVRDDLNRTSHGHAGLAGIAFLLFVLAYTPCIATVSAQMREIGARWTMIGVGLNLLLAWSAAVLVFQLGRLLW